MIAEKLHTWVAFPSILLFPSMITAIRAIVGSMEYFGPNRSATCQTNVFSATDWWIATQLFKTKIIFLAAPIQELLVILRYSWRWASIHAWTRTLDSPTTDTNHSPKFPAFDGVNNTKVALRPSMVHKILQMPRVVAKELFNEACVKHFRQATHLCNFVSNYTPSCFWSIENSDTKRRDAQSDLLIGKNCAQRLK
jgi:hypothetical protein